MDTNKIKAFLLVEKYKSFSKVAKEFAYTPSALSHMADSLEKDLGVTLFKRTPHGVELTDCGKQLYDKFSAIVEAENALLNAANVLAKEQDFVLRIGTYSSIARHILPEILYDFKEKHPEVKISIIVEDTIQDCLQNGTADLIFIEEYHRINEAEWCPIMNDRYVAVVPCSLFPEKNVVSKEMLYSYPFIQVNDAALSDHFTYTEFKEIVRIQSIENETAVSLVKENVGITVLPALTMNHCPNGVKVLELTPEVVRVLGIQYKRDNLSLTTKRFIMHLKGKYNL